MAKALNLQPWQVEVWFENRTEECGKNSFQRRNKYTQNNYSVVVILRPLMCFLGCFWLLLQNKVEADRSRLRGFEAVLRESNRGEQKAIERVDHLAYRSHVPLANRDIWYQD